MVMTQSSRLPRPLPASLLALGVATILCSPLAAQTRYRLTRAEAFRQEAGADAKELAQIPAGVEVNGGAPTDGFVEVQLQGWVWGASVARSTRDGHNLAISSVRGENLRVAPNGTVMARLLTGFLLDEVSREGAWVQARRVGWLPASALADVAFDPPPGIASDSGPAAAARPSLDRGITTRGTPFARTPESEPTGNLGPETPVRLLARNGPLVRVQVEGWVR